MKSFVDGNRSKYPDFYNAPVPSFGDLGGFLLIVGLAPGLKGANKTGRPFTGDFAGDLLYNVLSRYGLSQGHYQASVSDGLILKNCRLTNAVRCVPPENKVTGAEVTACGEFLTAEIKAMKNLTTILVLGGVAHRAVLKVLKLPQSRFPFRHGAVHELPGGLKLVDSYHTSRYNVNTGVMTEDMLDKVVGTIVA